MPRRPAMGIYDQLGGGFTRYSVDEQWLVPHFEKDALRQRAARQVHYLDGWRTLSDGREEHRPRALSHGRRRRCLRHRARMTDASGVFYSAQDADSEGEGQVLRLDTPARSEAVIGAADAPAICAFYDVEAAKLRAWQKRALAPTADRRASPKALGLSVDDFRRARSPMARPQLFEAREKRPEADAATTSAWCRGTA